MDLLKSIIELRLGEAWRPWLELRELLRSATGDVKAQVQGPPLDVDRQKDRQRISIRVRGLMLEHEVAGPKASLEQIASEAVRILTDLHEASPFQRVAEMEHHLYVIDPFEMPFHELVGYLKKRWLLPTRSSQPASDIGLIFDTFEGDVVKHLQLGPMDRNQLQSQYLRWPAEGLPETFVFLDIGYKQSTGEEGAAYSRGLFEEFLRATMDWQASEAEAVFAELRQGVT